MSRSNSKQKLCEFLDTISADEISSMEMDEHLSFEESGLVDSLAMLEIVSFLETNFEIDFSTIQIDPENLGSIRAILSLIERAGR